MNKLKCCLFGSCDSESACAQIGYTIFRVFIGLSLASHGLANKLPPAEGFIGLVEKMGMPAPTLSAWLAGMGEVIGGFLIAAGLLTRPAAMLAGLTMLGAVYTHYSGALGEDATGFGAMEKALLYLVSCIAIMSLGSGKFGVDRCLCRKD